MVFETLPDGLVVVDAQLRVLESNGRFARHDGRRRAGRPGGLRAAARAPLYDCFETTVRTGETSERTVRLPDDRIWQVAVAPLPDGHRAAAVGVLRDVTRLEQTESMRRTFVGDVSHELRTPIASIAAAAETLAEGAPDKTETAELLGLIRRQSDRMRELIDDLMDLAQIESGAVPLVREEIPLHELLSEVARRPRRRGAGAVAWTCASSATCPCPRSGDRRRVGQLARNLLDNAIKFSPEGAPVVVRVCAGTAASELLGGGPRARDPEGRARQDLPALLPGRPVALEGPAGLGPRVSRSSSTSPSSTAPRSTSRARSARARRSTSGSRRWRAVRA